MSDRVSYTNTTSLSSTKDAFFSFSPALLALLLGIAFFPGCAPKDACVTEFGSSSVSCSADKLFAHSKPQAKNSVTVTALAYTAQSVRKGRKAKSLPRAANGQYLTPDATVIAVSPDLMERYGLTLDKRVRLSGLSGEYVVADLMSGRHENTIDIYFGNDAQSARLWGRRTVTLSWE